MGNAFTAYTLTGSHNQAGITPIGLHEIAVHIVPAL